MLGNETTRRNSRQGFERQWLRKRLFRDWKKDCRHYRSQENSRGGTSTSKSRQSIFLQQFLQIKWQRTTAPERPVKAMETTLQHKLVLPVVSSPKIDYSSLTNNRSSAVNFDNQTVKSFPAVHVTPPWSSSEFREILLEFRCLRVDFSPANFCQ